MKSPPGGCAGLPIMLAGLRSRLLAVDACALCDGSGKLARVIDTVRPLKHGYKMAGVARTVRINGDFLGVLQAIRDASAGEVIMIDAGWRGAQPPSWPVCGGMFGELLAMEAQRRGLAGMVVDGNLRDSPALRSSLSIPIFSRGCHPNAGTATQPGEHQIEIQMANVNVGPGDFVFGDDDGVVVATPDELEEWLPRAEAIVERESEIFRAVQRGEPLLEQYPISDLAANMSKASSHHT